MTRDDDRRVQLGELNRALADGWRMEDDPVKIAARYKDRDLADTVPRCIMYLDIGVLMGTIERLATQLAQTVHDRDAERARCQATYAAQAKTEASRARWKKRADYLLGVVRHMRLKLERPS